MSQKIAASGMNLNVLSNVLLLFAWQSMHRVNESNQRSESLFNGAWCEIVAAWLCFHVGDQIVRSIISPSPCCSTSQEHFVEVVADAVESKQDEQQETFYKA